MSKSRIVVLFVGIVVVSIVIGIILYQSGQKVEISETVGVVTNKWMTETGHLKPASPPTPENWSPAYYIDVRFKTMVSKYSSDQLEPKIEPYYHTEEIEISEEQYNSIQIGDNWKK